MNQDALDLARRQGIDEASEWLSKITLSFHNPKTGGTIRSSLGDVAQEMKKALNQTEGWNHDSAKQP